MFIIQEHAFKQVELYNLYLVKLSASHLVTVHVASQPIINTNKYTLLQNTKWFNMCSKPIQSSRYVWFSLSTNPYCYVLVGSRNEFECDSNKKKVLVSKSNWTSSNWRLHIFSQFGKCLFINFQTNKSPDALPKPASKREWKEMLFLH